MDLSAVGPTREDLVVFDATYRIESDGYRYDTPVIHLFCRNGDGEPKHVAVDGFRPCFYITYDTFSRHFTDVLNDRRVLGVDVDFSGHTDAQNHRWRDYMARVVLDDESAQDACERPHEVVSALSDGHSANVYDREVFDPIGTAVGDDPELVKVYTKTPTDVGGGRGNKGLRQAIEDNWDAKTWEADIPFERRFLISSGIHRGFSSPTTDGGTVHVRMENWAGASETDGLVQELEPIDAPTASESAATYAGLDEGDEIRPRTLTVDIEVATHGGGVPDPVRAQNEVTAITSHDSYDDVYKGWFLRSDEWDESLTSTSFEDAIVEQLEIDGDVTLYDDETQMLEDFNSWATERRFDVITGWNSNTFDYPYLVQRSYELNAWSVRDWDQLANPGVWRNDDNFGDDVSFKIDGSVDWDMLDGYKKTLFRDVSSYRLDDVAQAELGYGKAPIEDIDEAWHHDPVDFVVYNTRDVEAVVEIERSSSLISLYEHMREVTGAPLTDCHTNGPMIDTLFLRKAFEKGMALPSNVAPDVQDFHGAYVDQPVPGIHDNVVYPDLASLYPYFMWTLNISPDTLIRSKRDLAESQYDEDDVFTAYVDKRGFETIPKGEEASEAVVDTDEVKGILDEEGSLRTPPGMFEPRYDEVYYLKPSVKQGFIRSTIDELIDLKNAYRGKGTMYDAVKRVTNSCYGVLGDSASMGKGFRLFDDYLAESITLGGRKTIIFTGEEYVRLINEFAVEDGFAPDARQVGGDTDSVMTSIPQAPDFLTALDWARRASEAFQGDGDSLGLYDKFARDEFDVDPEENEHRFDVEIESLASALFFKEDFDAGDGSGVKKRYVEHEVWEDDDGWIDTPDVDEGYENAPEDPDDLSEIKYMPGVTLKDYSTSGFLAGQNPVDNLSITGFEYVRSDIAPITAEVQERVFTELTLSENYEDRVYTYLEDLVDEVRNGDIDLSRIGRTKGVSQDLDDYGWKDYDELQADGNYEATETDERNGGRYVSTPGPVYRGLKYAIEHFPWQDDAGKPVRLYIDDVRAGEYPEVYTYDEFPRDDRPDPPEVGRRVDALAVDEPERIPEQFVPDYDKMLDKEVKSPIEDVLRTVDMDWSSVVGKGRQTSFDQF